MARLADRSDALAEGETLPRGALPALFRALDDAAPEARHEALAALAPRLADWPLVTPILGFAERHGLVADLFVAAVEATGPRSYCSLRQVQTLAEAASELPDPARWTRRVLTSLSSDPTPDPTELALELGVEAFCERLRELLRLRLGTPASRRCRTSAELAKGALAALAQVAPDEDAILASAVQILTAETRRAGKGEPVLALQALQLVERAPPVAQVRLLTRLAPRLKRRKVQTRANEILEAAAETAALGGDERAELTARTGGAEVDGWVRVPLEEGGETRIRVGPDGALDQDGEAPCTIDARAIESAGRRLLETWREHAGRLERAMLSGRRWGVGVWREIFVAGHPLWEDLASRIVWELHAGGEVTPFVWVEGPEDLFGEPVLLAEGGSVGVLHPTSLDADALELWREHALARAHSGGRLSPFAQAFRDVAPLGDEEQPFARFVGREAHQDGVGAMAQASGWSGAPLVGGGPWLIERGFPTHDLAVTVDLDEVKLAFRPTLAQRKAASRAAKKTGGRVHYKAPKDDRPRVAIQAVEVHGDKAALAHALPEVVRDLERLTDPLNTVTDLFLRAWQQRKWRDTTEAWREVVLAYRAGSPALLETRRVLLEAFLAREGLEARLEDRFVITGVWVIELGTGLCHQGVEKDHLPRWKADELAAQGSQGQEPLAFPFCRDAEPETVAVLERVVGLARAAALGLAEPEDDDDDDDD